MSKVAELAYDIEQLYIEGLHPTKIARQLGCPLSTVYDWLEQYGCGTGEETDPWSVIEDPHIVDASPYATINS